MSPEEEQFASLMVVGALRVVQKRRYITSDVAVLLQDEIDELQQEMREATIEIEPAGPTNDLEAASFGLRPVTTADYP